MRHSVVFDVASASYSLYCNRQRCLDLCGTQKNADFFSLDSAISASFSVQRPGLEKDLHVGWFYFQGTHYEAFIQFVLVSMDSASVFCLP